MISENRKQLAMRTDHGTSRAEKISPLIGTAVLSIAPGILT